MNTSKMSGVRKLINGVFEKGLSREEVEKIRARGGKIVYGLRKSGEVVGGTIVVDMAGKPYRIDNLTGVMTRNFSKGIPSHREKSKIKRNEKFVRIAAVLDFFKMPYRYMKLNVSNHSVFTRKGLATYERIIKDHRAQQLVPVKKTRKPASKKVADAVQA